MNRRDFLKVMALGIGAGGCSHFNPSGTAIGKSLSSKPNIILCMADDQGWGDMAYNGHPMLKTPHFDAMAAETLRFDRFYAAAPVCSPTRGSVMTGRHPNRFGCFKWGHTLRPQETTLAEALKTAGYVTGHFGKWHLGSIHKGSPVNPGASGFDEWFSAPNFFDNDPILSREGKAVATQGESSMVTVDAALDFIRKHIQGPQPFLAVVWFGSPHLPHQAIDQDRAVYKDQSEKRQNFYGEITGMDRAFGKLRRELRTLGIQDNTILWYCSDNGGLPNLGSTGGRGHKAQVYEGGLRVPAMLEWPVRFPKPRITEIPCNTSDIYPTLLEITGVKMADQPPLDGISLALLLEGRMKQRPRPMGFWDYPEKGISTPSKEWMASLLKAQEAGKEVDDIRRLRLDAGEIKKQYPDDTFPGHAAWLDWPWKLHRIEKDNRILWELYNLTDDPGETRNLIDKEPQRAAKMKDELEAWQKSVIASLNGEDY
ncbi:MAG: sulfatase-like hydrolase/transferase [Sedimentisphaerales bacterium]|nr:sulfatase-like hydrolase/transferase [Sedimentisphaerales bacterium]